MEIEDYQPCSKCNGFPRNGHCEYCGLFLDADESKFISPPSNVGINLTLENKNRIIYNKNFSFQSYKTYRIEVGPDEMIYSVNFYYNGKKYMIKGLSYKLSEENIFGQKNIENLKNDGLFPKTRNGYGEKITSINGEYFSDDELKNKFFLKGLKEFIIRLILDFHSNK